jgi:hypothetical protein
MSEPASFANFLSVKVAVQDCTDKAGRGVFAVTSIDAGEMVAVWGGRIVDRTRAEAIPEHLRRFIVQVGDEQFLAPLEPIDAAELINHCCQPTCGLSGQIALVALRRIQPGEEITFDYAATDSSAFLEFPCACSKSPCRQKVTRDDWQRTDAQAINRGHFSPYLQQRIDQANARKTNAAE